MKYTKEQLQLAVSNSVSYAGVLKFFKLSPSGGMQSYLKKRIKEFAIDTSHFTGQGHMRNQVANTRRSPEDILVLGSNLDHRVKATLLRRAMLESGIPEQCLLCGIANKWNGLPLTLEIDHISGESWDNRPENVRFLCPNCHSQQDTNKSWKYYVKPEPLTTSDENYAVFLVNVRDAADDKLLAYIVANPGCNTRNLRKVNSDHESCTKSVNRLLKAEKIRIESGARKAKLYYAI